MKPNVSFTIIAYNEEKNIANCINSILNQDGLKDYEIVVVNDASKDKTADIVKEFSKKNKKIRLVDLKVNKGRGNARFTGVKNAKGEYIAFIDADIILPKHWLKKCLLEIKNYDAIGGIAVPDGDVTYFYRKFNLIPKVLPPTTEITGNNGLYKRKSLLSINFDSNLKWGEDCDLNLRLKEGGNKLKNIPDLIVKHNESKSYYTSMKWAYQNGIGATKQLLKFKKIRLPDLAFFGFISLFIIAILEIFLIKSFYTGVLFLLYPLLTSFLHIRTRFKFEINHISKFLIAVLVNYPWIFLYYVGRVIGFL